MLELTNQEFLDATIAQKDDKDYEESGWVCLKVEDTFYLCRYCHCSCYDTYTDLAGGGIVDNYSDNIKRNISFSWSGTKEELVNMALNKLDPDMPTRTSEPEDSDYEHLLSVYSQLQKYFGLCV